MRTNTGTIEEVLPNGMVRIQTNRNSLYSPCSASLCADNVVIDAVNKIGAKKGEYVEFTIPDEHMVSGALLCFGLPLLLILLCAVAGAYIGFRDVDTKRGDYRVLYRHTYCHCSY